MRRRIEYNHLHDCITLTEYRALLRHCGRGSPYYLYWLLKAHCAARGGEIIDWRLGNISPDFKTISWETEKGRYKNESGRTVLITQHRTVELYDPFIIGELLQYLYRFFGHYEKEGKTFFCSPWGDGHLFPWLPSKKPLPGEDHYDRVRRAVNLTEMYFWKWRKKMAKQDSFHKRLSYESSGGSQKDSRHHVLRPHMLRSFGATIYYYKNGMDLKDTQKWICHKKISITDGYVKSAKALQSTPELIRTMDWASIAGFPVVEQHTIPVEIQCVISYF